MTLFVCPRHGKGLPLPIMDENPVWVTGEMLPVMMTENVGESQPVARRQEGPFTCPSPLPPLSPPSRPASGHSCQCVWRHFRRETWAKKSSRWQWYQNSSSLLANTDIRILPQSSRWQWYQNSSSLLADIDIRILPQSSRWQWYQNSSSVFSLTLISECFLNLVTDMDIRILLHSSHWHWYQNSSSVFPWYQNYASVFSLTL